MFCALIGHNWLNEVQTVSQIFFANEGFTLADGPVNQGFTLVSARGFTEIYRDGFLIARAENPFIPPMDGISGEKRQKGSIQKGVFLACGQVVPITPPWGMQVGVRPTKMAHELYKQGFDEEQIRRVLVDFYLVSEKKAALCLEVFEAEKRFLKDADKYVSLYIGVPFCTSRCLYCSFSAYTLKQYGKHTDAYTGALVKELKAAEPLLRRNRVQTVYVGGGTPTSLTEAQLERVLSAVAEICDVPALAEFTVEAGRPDSITPGKLDVLKRFGVGRVSVNPQTLKDGTLRVIGRSHSAADFYAAYETAEKRGFLLNTDLIMGLPGETVDDTRYTMEKILELSPGNVTLHTLAVKRASMLRESLSEADGADFPRTETASAQLDLADELCRRAGYAPYYMYRQKNIAGNLENAGYSKPGGECVYNIQMIGDRQSIIAFGAGAASKLYIPERNLVRRAYNVKAPVDYIARIDEMTERKKKLYEYAF
ncbi:MAG: coproporphyrinogen dehydrogenase HemZ [Clostridiales bacterium]|jgi:oxygen-independent coproporphyrinogen-3 oxidase|nr:coproporphyrinogen dehydrogenase HemZ [Clostridiales bacterium]